MSVYPITGEGIHFDHLVNNFSTLNSLYFLLIINNYLVGDTLRLIYYSGVYQIVILYFNIYSTFTNWNSTS